MAQLMETAMLLCFGLSWPFNILKSWNSRTAKGKSIGFELLILLGYALGIAGKFLSHNVSYVLVVYILDILMVSIDLILTIRNKFLDKRADRRAERRRKNCSQLCRSRPVRLSLRRPARIRPSACALAAVPGRR